MKNRFVKSHGLGNDYIVIDSEDTSFPINSNTAKRICDVHYGIGSDGLLVKVPSNKTDFKVEMYNPDGSKFEKSGNGLRIFSKYIYDYGFTQNKIFSIQTDGGNVKSEIIEVVNSKATVIKVDMGQADFNCRTLSVDIVNQEYINELLQINDRQFYVNAVSMGNPHCVVFRNKIDKDEIIKYGPFIENNPIFLNRTNVQFVVQRSRNLADILIWERGVGFTNASGTSSCAVAAILKKLDKMDNKITIRMPGGLLDIKITDDFKLTMTGEVRQIAQGIFSDELIRDLI